jgi:xanthine/CO dehydrogenase XdhC/CoxF family maturation factor
METELLLELWRRARGRGEEVFLATVAHVQGSSYRKPGARMLVTSGGERAGTISGGCLEAEVSQKIAWITRNGPSLQTYQSSFDDDDEGVPYGLGCGGTIWVLMEAGEVVDAVMEALRLASEQRIASVVVSSLAKTEPHRTVVIAADRTSEGSGATVPWHGVRKALAERRAIAIPSEDASSLPDFLCVPVLPVPRLHIFGAGDDAQPIVRFAAELGWQVTVADGRRHLLRRERFPKARHLSLLTFRAADSPRMRDLADHLAVADGDSAVILTHSYEQDHAILKALVDRPLQYLGILGPMHRTRRLLDSICNELELSVEECLGRLHAPVGLNIGSDNPAIIALSIIAEIQAKIAGMHVRVEHAGHSAEALLREAGRKAVEPHSILC